MSVIWHNIINDDKNIMIYQIEISAYIITKSGTDLSSYDPLVLRLIGAAAQLVPRPISFTTHTISVLRPIWHTTHSSYV